MVNLSTQEGADVNQPADVAGASWGSKNADTQGIRSRQKVTEAYVTT